MVRRFLLAIVLCLVLLLSATGEVVRAQTTDPADNPNGYQLTKKEVDAYHEATTDCSAPSLECLVRNTTRFVAIEWLNDIVGQPITYNVGPSDGQIPRTNSLNNTSPIVSRTGGATKGLISMIGGMYAYQPATTSRYVADVLDNAGIASPAYAQGLGFASLDPILSLWKSFRNVAYFFFIAVIIVIGIMIMLRQKISAQASVTAQQALPSIIISLILVTFSYAIAGILIDVMYLSMYLITGLFSTILPEDQSATKYISMTIFQLGGTLFTDQFKKIGNNMNLITQVITSLAGNTDASWWTGAAGFFGGLTLSIILAVAVLIGIVKLFLELLKSYASIIMGVVFAPIYLMMGAFPGRNTFSPWFKNMVGNLAAFPTTLLFVIIYQIFTANIGENGQGGFMPPYLIGNGQSGIAGYMIGLAILLALPEIVKEVKKKMGASEGGFGYMVAAAANARRKEAWNKGFMGVTAKGITKFGAGAAGAALITPVAAGVGAALAPKVHMSRSKGALIGAAAPITIAGGIPIATSGIKLLNRGMGAIQKTGRSFASAESLVTSAGSARDAAKQIETAESARGALGALYSAIKSTGTESIGGTTSGPAITGNNSANKQRTS